MGMCRRGELRDVLCARLGLGSPVVRGARRGARHCGVLRAHCGQVLPRASRGSSARTSAAHLPAGEQAVAAGMRWVVRAMCCSVSEQQIRNGSRPASWPSLARGCVAKWCIKTRTYVGGSCGRCCRGGPRCGLALRSQHSDWCPAGPLKIRLHQHPNFVRPGRRLLVPGLRMRVAPWVFHCRTALLIGCATGVPVVHRFDAVSCWAVAVVFCTWVEKEIASHPEARHPPCGRGPMLSGCSCIRCIAQVRCQEACPGGRHTFCLPLHVPHMHAASWDDVKLSRHS